MLSSFVCFLICIGFHQVSYCNEQSVRNKWVIAQVFLKSICSGYYHLFFSCLLFLTTLEALKIIVLPAPSYILHQQLFVEKLTDHPWVISWKLWQSRVNPFASKITLVILLTACHVILMMLVQRIWYWIN